MTRFVRRYPLVKFTLFNVLAVLAYDTLGHDSARAAAEPHAKNTKSRRPTSALPPRCSAVPSGELSASLRRAPSPTSTA